MNIKRKLERLWERLFLYHYLTERILDEQFNIILLTEAAEVDLEPYDRWSLQSSRRNLQRLMAFRVRVA